MTEVNLDWLFSNTLLDIVMVLLKSTTDHNFIISDVKRSVVIADNGSYNSICEWNPSILKTRSIRFYIKNQLTVWKVPKCRID